MLSINSISFSLYTNVRVISVVPILQILISPRELQAADSLAEQQHTHKGANETRGSRMLATEGNPTHKLIQLSSAGSLAPLAPLICATGW